jgi:hypothetical protein
VLVIARPARVAGIFVAVCALWRRLSSDDEYWRALCASKYGVTPESFDPPPDPVKNLFFFHEKRFRQMIVEMARGQRAQLLPQRHAALGPVPRAAVLVH